MLETLKKILANEKKEAEKKAEIQRKEKERDYYFNREIDILFKQGRLNNVDMEKDNDKGN
tara:strand:- start:128 stop:307 length:180 start_codon:yes stop_codon:yes gene_type:complete